MNQTSTIDIEDLRQKLSQYLKDENISIREFSKQAHISRNWLGEFLKGTRQNLKMDTLATLYEFIGYHAKVVSEPTGVHYEPINEVPNLTPLQLQDLANNSEFITIKEEK